MHKGMVQVVYLYSGCAAVLCAALVALMVFDLSRGAVDLAILDAILAGMMAMCSLMTLTRVLGARSQKVRRERTGVGKENGGRGPTDGHGYREREEARGSFFCERCGFRHGQDRRCEE